MAWNRTVRGRRGSSKTPPVEFDQLAREIADDRIRDGITISALALAWAKGEFQNQARP